VVVATYRRARSCVCAMDAAHPIQSPRSTQTVEEKDPTGHNSRPRGTVSPENGPRKLYLNILTTEIVPTNKQNKTNRGKKNLGAVPNFLRVGRQKDRKEANQDAEHTHFENEKHHSIGIVLVSRKYLDIESMRRI